MGITNERDMWLEAAKAGDYFEYECQAPARAKDWARRLMIVKNELMVREPNEYAYEVHVAVRSRFARYRGKMLIVERVGEELRET